MSLWIWLLVAYLIGSFFPVSKVLSMFKGATSGSQVLLVAMVAMIVGYSMIYAVMHGDWAFWKYWFPATTPNA